jgi:group I intron endonuclease
LIIYKITNKINGKVYIGQTTRALHERWVGHCHHKHKKRSAVGEAIKVYGKENFTIEEIAQASTREELDQLEIKYIAQLNSLAPNGYNLKTGGSSGYRYTKESRQRMRESKLGTHASEDTKQKMSDIHSERWKDQGLRDRKSKSSKEIWQSDSYRKKISKSRKTYWSDLSNRDVASQRAKQALTPELREQIGEAVKNSHNRSEVQVKIQASVDRHKRAVVDSNGVVYSSIKEAAEKNNTSGSSIIKVIKGRYKSAGGLTFQYLEEKIIKKPIVYMVCGLSGSGKSWVCNQLSNMCNYVSFDNTSKDKHIELLIEAGKAGKTSLYDPTIGVSSFIKHNSDKFDIRPTFIIELKNIISARLEARGGMWREGMDNRLKSMDKRTIRYGVFHGTSQEVLDYLKKELTQKLV